MLEKHLLSKRILNKFGLWNDISKYAQGIKEIHDKISFGDSTSHFTKTNTGDSLEALLTLADNTEERDKRLIAKLNDVLLSSFQIAQRAEVLLKLLLTLRTQQRYGNMGIRDIHSIPQSMPDKSSHHHHNISTPQSSFLEFAYRWKCACEYDKQMFQKRWTALAGRWHLHMFFDAAVGSLVSPFTHK